MKILIADSFPQSYISEISNLGVETLYKPKLKAEEIAANIGDASVLIVRSTEVRADCINAGKCLSLIIRAGAGVNTIDVKAANTRGIYVANCPGKNSIAVAELTMALLLSLDRRVVENVSDLRNGKWNKSEYSKADGIFGKTIGVIGVGQIGREVITRAKAFGLHVIAWSRSLTPEKAEKLGVEYSASVEALVPVCDIVSIHVALKPETRNLINRSIIRSMKPGTIFLNTSRAEVVDESALREAVTAGTLKIGADVFSNEPEEKSGPFAHPLASLPGVYGTHHIGASTNQAQNAVAAEVVAIINDYLHHGTVRNWVNRAKKTAAKWQLVVRHFDKPGVLANVLDDLKSSKINVQEVENVIFEGQQTACCTMKLDAKPTEEVVTKIQSRSDEVIQASVVSL
ncbi:MAG TPA: 3-phosphoglycerate dehydrogenase family protein [Bacteroidota bacterium]|nr:3-phosphoglycerate dehydrogenase family protein [Bacteroidota bacterium]